MPNLLNIFEPGELQNKIANLDYHNSILNKINTSKYVTKFESKVSFIFQYACYLELYFAKDFLSKLRAELLFNDEVVVRKLKL
jgi:hypothetical protein